MTPAEIATLPAGSELDALIHTLVMAHPLAVPSYRRVPPPAYSTDWGAAGMVVDYMKSKDAYWEIASYSLGWTAACWWQGTAGGYRNADTGPLAICRAALLAVQGETT